MRVLGDGPGDADEVVQHRDDGEQPALEAHKGVRGHVDSPHLPDVLVQHPSLLQVLTANLCPAGQNALSSEILMKLGAAVRVANDSALQSERVFKFALLRRFEGEK